MKKIIYLILLTLIVFNCSSDDDKEQCEDGYWLRYFLSCDSSQGAVIYVSVEEGVRIKDELNHTQENCVSISGLDNNGEPFSGFYLKDISGDLEFWDCSENCIACFDLG